MYNRFFFFPHCFKVPLYHQMYIIYPDILKKCGQFDQENRAKYNAVKTKVCFLAHYINGLWVASSVVWSKAYNLMKRA